MKVETVYVPVKAVENLPDENKEYFTYCELKTAERIIIWGLESSLFDLNDGKFKINDRYQSNPTHWLKPTEAVLLSKEDAEKITADIVCAVNQFRGLSARYENSEWIAQPCITEVQHLNEALQLLNK